MTPSLPVAPPIALRLDAAELVACVGCGLCLPHCPTYRVTGEELASPRGRIAAMRAVSEGRAPLDLAFTAAMDACIQCRACEAACPSGVQFGHLMEDTRAGHARGDSSSRSRSAVCSRTDGCSAPRPALSRWGSDCASCRAGSVCPDCRSGPRRPSRPMPTRTPICSPAA